MHQTKSKDYEEYIQDRVLRERKQGEERKCPHHGASDNQRDYCTVQLQTDHPEDALGCERQPRQRQEQGGTGGKLRVGKYQGADNEALPADFRP